MNETSNETKAGDLQPGEPHPAAVDAFHWIMGKLKSGEISAPILQESFASVGMSGNRCAEVCGDTLYRILTFQPVSDRYLMGLAWTMKSMEELEREKS